MQDKAAEVVSLVMGVRRLMPRIGTRKLHHLLEDSLTALGVGRDKLFDVLRANNMLIVPKRQYRQTTNSKHMFHKHKNLVLDRIPTRPEEIWVSDITYVGTRNKHTYLALVTDAYSKKIVGYDLSDSLSAEGAVRALQMACRGRMYKKLPLIHHSDRGIQYCCDDYQRQLEEHHIQVSMTESYDPYANAVAERVNATIKHEFLLEELECDLGMQQRIVAQSVAIYNELRPHLSCGMLTPDEMHRQCKKEIVTYRTKNDNTARRVVI